MGTSRQYHAKINVAGFIFRMTTSEDIARKHGMMIPKEVTILKECLALIPDNPIVVNIGAGYGTSSAAILEVRPNATLFSVDKFLRPEEFESLEACGIDRIKCKRLLGISWEVAKSFILPIDFLFIDGDHGTEAVRNDINAWIPKVVSYGIVAFHDYNHRNVPGLKVVVDKAMSKHEVIGKHRYLIVYRLLR